MRNILYIIIAIALIACGKDGDNNVSPSSNQSMMTTETASPNSTACTSKADYEFGVKNGLTMAPPCENITAQAENYKLTLKTSTCEQWLQSEENSSKFKITLKNDSRTPIRLVGKLGFRSANNELLAEWTLYPSNSLQPNADTIEEVTLSVACKEIKEITLSSVDSVISKIDEKQITPTQVQVLRKDFEVQFNPAEWVKRSKVFEAQSGVVHSTVAETSEQAKNSPQCEKMNNWASDSRELVGKSLEVSLSSIALLRFQKGQIYCIAIVDTPKGPVKCAVQKIRQDKKSGEFYADLGNVLGDAICGDWAY